MEIYIGLALICWIAAGLYASLKSGIFYAARRVDDVHPKLKPYYDNIHRISSPANLFRMGVVFFFMVYIYHLKVPNLPFYMVYLYSYLVAVGTNTLKSERWQVNINRGCGLPDYNEYEDHYSEWILGFTNTWTGYTKVVKIRKHLSLKHATRIYRVRVGRFYIPVGISIWISTGKIFNGRNSRWLYLIGAIELITGFLPLLFKS